MPWRFTEKSGASERNDHQRAVSYRMLRMLTLPPNDLSAADLQAALTRIFKS